MRLSMSVVTGGLMVVAMTAFGIQPVSATDDGDAAGLREQLVKGSVSMSTGVQQLDANALRDAREAARTDGIDPSVMLRRAEILKGFESVLAKIMVDHPDTYALSGLVRGDVEQPWIAFKGQAPKDAERAMSKLSFDTLLISNAPASSSEMEQAAAASVSRVSEVTGSDFVTSSVDPNSLRLTVKYGGAGFRSYSAVDLSTVATEAAQQAVPGFAPVTTEAVANDPIEPMSTVQGGRPLCLGGSPDCTAGFTAVRNGNRGVLTAKHCPNTLTYMGEANVITFGAGASSAPNGMIDLQFYRTLSPHSTNAQFRATGMSSGDDRAVTQVGNPTVGSPVCKWGHTSGYGCSSVAEVDVCVTYSTDGKARCGLARSASAIIQPGDSGGPWFYSSTARGITAATNASYSYFTQIGRASTYLDATVLQQ